MCQNFKTWSRRFARQGWHFVTLNVWDEECVCAAVVRVNLACQCRETMKPCPSPRFRRCGHAVLRGKRGILWRVTWGRKNVCAWPSWGQSWGDYGENNQNVSFPHVRRCGHAVLHTKRGSLWLDVFQKRIWVCVCVCVCARSRREGKVGVSMGETTKTFFSFSSSHVSDVVISFCMASVALCALTCFKNEFGCVCVCARSRREGKVGVSMGGNHKNVFFFFLLSRVRCGHFVLHGKRGALWH